MPLVPSSFDTYYEPFVGGGALFFALSPAKAVLSDKNTDLINCYIQVRDHPEEVKSFLKSYVSTKEEYYRIRSFRPGDPIEQAARFIYLTSHSFNGLYRLNARGEFNVPFGDKNAYSAWTEQRLDDLREALRGATVRACDFEETLERAGSNDFVYLDPPYTVAHKNNGFRKYNATLFSWDDQQRLAKRARALVTQGCAVVVSNADHQSVRELYADFDVVTVSRTSRIAASSSHRQEVTECIFYSGVERGDR